VTAVVHLITRSAAITGHHQQQKTWSVQLRHHAQLVGLAPRTQIHGVDLRLFVYRLGWASNAAGHRHGSSTPSRTATLCACDGTASSAADLVNRRLRVSTDAKRLRSAAAPRDGAAWPRAQAGGEVSSLVLGVLRGTWGRPCASGCGSIRQSGSGSYQRLPRGSRRRVWPARMRRGD
jgi:hypothetical protein